MLKTLLIATVALLLCSACGEDRNIPDAAGSNSVADVKSDTLPRKGIRIDFRNTKLDSHGIPTGWRYRAAGLMTPDTKYAIESDLESGEKVLRVISDKASGVLFYDLSKIDLEKYPVMRWKWKAVRLPAGADARIKSKDDQGIAIYIGYGRISQLSVSYTWQTDTPKGTEGKAVYHGMVTTHWYGLRDKNDGEGVWHVEERNVRNDIRAKFETDKLPSGLALTISANSQYTGTNSISELEYIEFVEEK